MDTLRTIYFMDKAFIFGIIVSIFLVDLTQVAKSRVPGLVNANTLDK